LLINYAIAYAYFEKKKEFTALSINKDAFKEMRQKKTALLSRFDNESLT